jgi:signal peptidase I
MLKNRIANPIVRSLVEWLLSLALAFLLFFILKNYVFRLANVTGSSMEPTLMHNDMVLLSRLSYRFSEPEAGDIVAFPFKENPSEFYIKRVIGMPGDEIDLIDQQFLINNEPLSDMFSRDIIFSTGDVHFPFIVAEDCYFMLGDNRNGSKDSRFSSVGSIARDEMVGKVMLRVWPLHSLGTVE